MENFYMQNTANFIRQKTDKHFINYENSYKFDEITDKTAKFMEVNQLLDLELWERFVRQFEIHSDSEMAVWMLNE